MYGRVERDLVRSTEYITEYRFGSPRLVSRSLGHRILPYLILIKAVSPMRDVVKTASDLKSKVRS